MTKWYYVQGSERIGPVGEDVLHELFMKEVINSESYIWRKGFANWEKLKDVAELDFKSTAIEALGPIADVKPEKKERRDDKKHENQEIVETNKVESQSSPEIVFNFDWHAVKNEDELFFLKIGHDRKHQQETNLFGPYSLNELKEALDEKRINNHTLLFAAGMPGWVEVGQTPLDPKKLKLNTSNIIDETPLLIVVKHEPLPLITLVQIAGTKNCTLLGAGPFKAGNSVIGTIYSGTTMKARNLKMTIESYDPKEQKVFCKIDEINESAKKIMQNYAK